MKILILGATSGIAQAFAKQAAREGHNLVLVARDQNKLQPICQDIEQRYQVDVHQVSQDLANVDQIESNWQQIINAHQDIEAILLAYGSLPNQQQALDNAETFNHAINTNFVSACHWLRLAGQFFKAKQSGHILAISSVAGDRGRMSNYVYGACKGGLTRFLQGLTNELAHEQVQVITIKPGFVDTPMTDGLNKSGPLWASADDVAKPIVKSLYGKSKTIYVPGFWRFIMLVIQHIPGFVFNRLRF